MTLSHIITLFDEASIKEAKRLYYTRTFTIYKNDIKQTWTIIKDTLHRKIALGI